MAQLTRFSPDLSTSQQMQSGSPSVACRIAERLLLRRASASLRAINASERAVGLAQHSHKAVVLRDQSGALQLGQQAGLRDHAINGRPRAEHRDTQAIHAKLDEVLHALGDALNEFTRIDEKELEEIERRREHIRKGD